MPLSREMPARVVLAQVGRLVVRPHNGPRRSMALDARACLWATLCGRQIARLCAAMVSRRVFRDLLRLLRLLLGFVELVEILAKRRVSLLADEVMALGLVVGGTLLAAFRW
jgi:hypothetical protein